jgi:hypothetical protein
MPLPPARSRFNSNINPAFNPKINPKATASLNPRFSPWLNPLQNGRISPRFNHSLNPIYSPMLNPTTNALLDPRQTSKYSGLRRWSPDGELAGFVVGTSNKAVLLLFDQEIEWTSFAVDNQRQGYNVFDLHDEWIGYWVRNALGGLNEALGAWPREAFSVQFLWLSKSPVPTNRRGEEHSYARSSFVW